MLFIPLWKHCNKCGHDLSATLENFSSHARGKYGLRAICKSCRAERERKRRRDDPSIKERDRERNKHPDRIAWKQQYMHGYVRSERYKQWDRERNKRRRQTPEYIEYERKRISGSVYQAWQHDYLKRYYGSPHGKAIRKARYQRRQARALELPDTFTAQDWERALEYFEGRCAVCGRPQGLWHTLAADHWIPLSSPNCPGTVPENMVPLCHQLDGCNNRKSDKLPEQWLVETFGGKRAREILARINAYFEWVRGNDENRGSL